MARISEAITGIKSGIAVGNNAGTLMGTDQQPTSSRSVYITINNNTSYVIGRHSSIDIAGFSALNGWVELKPYTKGTIRCESDGFMRGAHSTMVFEAKIIPCIRRANLPMIKDEEDRRTIEMAMGENNIMYLPNKPGPLSYFSLRAESPYIGRTRFGICFDHITDVPSIEGPTGKKCIKWNGVTQETGFTIHYEGNETFNATMNIDLEE